jgi:hypothetical protein
VGDFENACERCGRCQTLGCREHIEVRVNLYTVRRNLCDYCCREFGVVMQGFLANPYGWTVKDAAPEPVPAAPKECEHDWAPFLTLDVCPAVTIEQVCTRCEAHRHGSWPEPGPAGERGAE